MAKGKYQQWLTEDGLLLLKGWARDGLTEENIARNCGIAMSTLSDWKIRFPEIAEAIKKNKEVPDYIVENALYKSATGYDYTEMRTEYVVDKDQKPTGSIKITKTKKHMPPNVMAALAWLNNRKPDYWRRNAGKEKLDEKRFEHQKDVDDKKVW